MAKNKRTQGSSEVTWAQAFRDIIIRSMDGGQLPPVLGFFFFLALIWRMPEDKIYEFGVYIVDGFKDFSLAGWLVSVVLAILWAGHARTMSRNFSAEYQRIGKEKSNLQGERSQVALGSSDND